MRDRLDIPSDITEAFDLFDTDKDGSIDKEELRTALVMLDVKLNARTVDQLFAMVAPPDVTSLNVQQLDQIVTAVRARKAGRPEVDPVVTRSILGARPLPKQAYVRQLYTSTVVMYSVASVIVANFVVNIVEKEIDPNAAARRYGDTWDALDLAFNVAFLLELLFNMYGYGGPTRAFWSSGWNVFDFAIVAVGVVLMTGTDVGFLNRLKLLRALRVFRLFKRIKSLNKIIEALIGAIPGVINAFVIMFIFFCIYAILAVELFRPFGEGGTYEVQSGGDAGAAGAVAFSEDVSSVTARGYSNGYEYFGSFSRAMFTLFQVMTGESWAEAIARPLIFGLFDDALVTGIFFVSFVILTQVVLLNVVVVVLFDNFDLSKPGDDDEKSGEGVSGDEVVDSLSAGSSQPEAGSGAVHQLGSAPVAAANSEQKLDLIFEELRGLQRDVDRVNGEIEKLYAFIPQMQL